MLIESRYVSCKKGNIELYTLTNSMGAIVELSSLGAGINKIIVPDADGTYEDVILGYINPGDYLYDGACAGRTPGRFANRIANGRFSIEDVEYQLAINNPPNALHGGVDGFHNQLWDSRQTPTSVIFSYHSKNEEEGFPGNLDVTVEYSWSDNNRLTIDYKAVTDMPTIVNLTNHAYFNLSGENSGSCLNHELQLNCSRWLPADDTDIPYGDMESVKDTPMDFVKPKRLGRDINKEFYNLRKGKGYNHFFLVDNWDGNGKLHDIATLIDPISGRILKIASTHCGAMIYTGNWLNNSPIGKSGFPYNNYDGIAIECQEAPDAPNHPQFPSTILHPHECYHHIIQYSFS